MSWFKRKRDDHVNGDDEERTSHERPVPRDDHDQIVTERTRLLGQNIEPEVTPSPYNLAVVRSLRNISIFFTLVTMAWWIVLFVSIFVNIPGLYTRGSGFTELAYAFITIFALMNSITFFATPLPRGVRGLSLALSVFLFVNALIILVSPPLRHHEGWVGLATVLWAALIGGIWTVVTDRVVEWGKAEEEERLIGRVEERYTGTEWLKVIFSTTGLIVVVLLEVLITLTLVLRMRDASLEPTGRRYWVFQHKFQVHVACFGNASDTVPTVFVEGGQRSAEYFSTWVAEAQEEGIIGQYCYWDRPGYAFSDNAPSPMSAGSAIDILSAALPKANITEDGPGWILVAHENGALYSQVFASRHTSQVKGMLFVDGYPSTMIPRIYTPARTFLLLLRGIISPLGVDRLSDWIFKHRSRIDRVYGASSWRSDRVIKSQFQESLAAGAITRNEIIAAEAIIPERIPVTVVSSGIPCEDSKEWEEGQRYLGRKSEKHVWDVVGNVHRDLWKHDEGRRLLKKRFGQLVKGR